jgi:hypothetical protein
MNSVVVVIIILQGITARRLNVGHDDDDEGDLQERKTAGTQGRSGHLFLYNHAGIIRYARSSTHASQAGSDPSFLASF